MKKENFLTSGIGIGVLIGTIIGIATDNLGLWISLGIVIGAAVGTTLRQENKEN